MAWIAKMSCSKAEVNGHRAAVATLVLQEVHTMFRTVLQDKIIAVIKHNIITSCLYLCNEPGNAANIISVLGVPNSDN